MTAGAAEAPTTLVRERRLGGSTLLAIPGLVFLALVFGLPLGYMAYRSVADPSPENYLVFTQSSIYLTSLVVTLRTAAVVSLVCLVLGYPYALLMLLARPWVALLLGTLVLLPFWSSVLVRSYAWTVILQETGIVNSALMSLGIVSEPLPIIRNSFAVTVGMTHVLLPMMVLPLYASMRHIDRDLMAAASGLGATPLRAFWKVFFPLSLPGVGAGLLMVFVQSIGFFIVPALLGSPRDSMFSELIVTQVNALLRFGVGAALGMTLLVITLVVLGVGTRFVRIEQAIGYTSR